MLRFLIFVLFAVQVIAQQHSDTWLRVGTLVGLSRLSVYAFVFSCSLHFIPQTGLHVRFFLLLRSPKKALHAWDA